MPTSFGIRNVIPLAPFAERHPNLHIQLQLGDKRQDWCGTLSTPPYGLAVWPFDRDRKTHRDYPACCRGFSGLSCTLRCPETPDDLARHRIIGGTAAAVPAAWRFERDDQELAIKLEAHFSTNENEGAIAAAVAGFGITSTSGWACRRELEDGSLVRVLTSWALAGIPVQAYFPMGRATRAAARAVIDHLAACFDRAPPTEPI